jgi:hypothetical protein
MAKLWMTYAWKDNEDQQVDFIIGALKETGLAVSFDRAHLVPGQRLWDSIDKAISDPAQSDAWAIYATKNSLSSEPCLEEHAYALDRTLRTRGQQFPLIGIFSEPLDRSLIPSAIATRLYVNLRDPEWAMKVAAGVALRAPQLVGDVQPYIGTTHVRDGKVLLELRPRAGRWYPFMIVVPTPEVHLLRGIEYGPSGSPPSTSVVGSNQVGIENLNGKSYKGVRLHHAVDALNSAYVGLSAIPSEILFGSEQGFGQGTAYQLLRR